MKETVISKTGKKEAAGVHEKTGLDTVSKVSLAFMGSVSTVIGIWAIIALVSGMSRVGPVELFKSWFQAVTGM